MVKRYCILCFFVWLSAVLGAASLSGTIQSEPGQELEFFYISNFITGEREVVAQCEVSEQGSYQFDFSSDERRIYYVGLGTRNAQIILAPDQALEIDLPEYIPMRKAEFLNPYFEQDNILVYNDSVKDANYYITEVEVLSTLLLKDVLNSTNPTQVALEALKELKDYGQEFDDPLLKEYIKYNEPLFYQFAHPDQYGVTKQIYLKNAQPDLQNMAFIKLFNSEYDNPFLLADGQFSTLISNAIVNDSLPLGFLDLLASEMRIENRSMLELVAVKGFYNAAVFAPSYEKPIARLLEQLAPRLKDEEVRAICSATTKELQRLMVGSEAPYHELFNLKGKRVPLVLKRKHVLLAFINTDAYACQVHLHILNQLKERYKRDIEIVCATVYQSSDELSRFLKRNDFEHLFFTVWNNNEQLLYDYKVEVLPTYCLIGPDGKLVSTNLPSPEEGMEEELQYILGE